MSDLSDSIHDYDFELPDELIAQSPAPERDASRLLVVRRNPSKGLPQIEDLLFSDLPRVAAEEALASGLWVRNVSKVIPARFYARRPSGGEHEIVLLEDVSSTQARLHSWKALIKRSARLSYPQKLLVTTPDGEKSIEVFAEGLVDLSGFGHDPLLTLARIGEMPLPPYIRERDPVRDHERYQTVWARADKAASVAAPTASLHFTPRVLSQLEAAGASFADLVLHVGLGTFEPLRQTSLSAHELHSERIEAAGPELRKIEEALVSDRPLVALGTTALRTLESLPVGGFAARPEATLTPLSDGGLAGRTQLFVRPGFEFRATRALVTNFHLPQSTLFVLVSCFAGSRALALEAYRHAVAQRYRFFSFGDASIWI